MLVSVLSKALRVCLHLYFWDNSQMIWADLWYRVRKGETIKLHSIVLERHSSHVNSIYCWVVMYIVSINFNKDACKCRRYCTGFCISFGCKNCFFPFTNTFSKQKQTSKKSFLEVSEICIVGNCFSFSRMRTASCKFHVDRWIHRYCSVAGHSSHFLYNLN